MGYFNIFYKITRVIDMLTRKRNRRAIMFILIIIGIICLLHNKGYCAQEDTTYTTDTTYFMLEEYNNLCDFFVSSFDKYYGKDNVITARFNVIFDSIQNGNFPYFYTSISSGNMRLYLYSKNQAKTFVDTSLVYNDGTRIPTTAYNYTHLAGNIFYYISLAGSNVYTLNQDSSSSDIGYTVPLIILFKIPTQVYNCMVKAGYTYENNQDIIDIKALLQQQNNKLDSINDSLTNSTYNEEVVEVDTSAIDNVPEEQITGLFTSVIGAFQNSLSSYGGTITKVIPLPHGRTNRDSKQYCINSLGKSYRSR